MASIGHLAVGAALGALYSRKTGSNPKVAIATFAAAALAPDLDLFAHLLGARPDTPLSHRGITHSLTFALAVAALVALSVRPRGRGTAAGLVTFGSLASHGLLDAMSQAGKGPQLLWPLSDQGYELLWSPIPGVPELSDYLTLQAVPTLAVETLMFLPLIVFTVLTVFPRSVKKGVASETVI